MSIRTSTVHRDSSLSRPPHSRLPLPAPHLPARRSVRSLLAIAGAALLGAGGMSADALAQPFNVRSWYADGQVFVVWQFPAPPAAPTDTIEVYASAAAEASVNNMQRVGRLFYPEYTGARLQALVPAARLQIPTPAGGTYRLAADEGVFAFTPRQAGNLFFAVVDTGSIAVNAGNSDATAFNYDPAGDPIRPHEQFIGITPGGNPYTAYVVFADGRDDYNNARPDVPVLADADKNGVPHVFTITRPDNALPNAPLSCLFALHGGGGEYQLFRPGIPARANLSLELDDGIVVTPDDSIYTNVEGMLGRSNTSWFGYTPEFDPFFSLQRSEPSSGAVVVNFTQRRIHWILDWLESPISPFTIDPRRVAMVGHSGGGRGTSHLTRLRPERFAAAVVYTPASNLTIDDAGQVNFLRGNWDQNLATNIPDPSAAGGFVGVTDIFTMTTRLSPERDFTLTRVFYGKRDEADAAAWSSAQRAVFDSLDDSRAGYMLFFDEREHGPEMWHLETNDAGDGHAGPWPDVGQWIAPVRTRRASGQYLVDTYRPDQSYPGFFDADADTATVGQQPDPGPGDPDLGDAWGTWGGYADWDTTTIVDTPTRWGCTVFLTGLSATSVDNSPYASVTMSMIPRRPRNFAPPEGAPIAWSAIDLASGTVLQAGVTTAEPDGVVQVAGLIVPVDPARVRVVIRVDCPGDFSADGVVNSNDYFSFLGAFFANSPAADFNSDGTTNSQDFFDFLAAFFSPCI